ncbi:phosphonate metabolism protein/1,5-bisphosphokinase (PRPP-forming) PhnN (plasmid) [Mesorhizobium sp. AR07]|uniref:phosphonate metabolism protein/1,5-bisphosphokinase (PRPP-forming) PhnN n=1 Tax=Mesorhizobium sp. AR07 TaxID=2865838 RepID=UPI00215F94E8|nr:phosphonate metabolism protein/1,5-bisphosphokinase (PRPP-forming) PhnN [Mesorhizobium sp. AR07]UVK48178.1 phosphonate metabolism protein/1,5-bisphosphokinase (PRPP-forming) PhnN [Mesorhizobium sp. AR07]
MSPIAGKLVLVVGASGAGKDTLIDYARMRLRDDPGVHFVRRIISRPVTTGEFHEAVQDDEFERRVVQEGFALHWQAHGHRYGISSEIDIWLERGDVVVANGSRAMLEVARQRYPDLLVVSIIVPPAILAQRLAARGRETKDAIRLRLLRNSQVSVDGERALQIDNSRAPQIGGEHLVQAICNFDRA